MSISCCAADNLFFMTSHITSADGRNDCQQSFACSTITLNASSTCASFPTHADGHLISSLSASSGRLPWPRQKKHACPPLSLLHSIINTSLGSSFFFFFVLVWPISLFCFVRLIICLMSYYACFGKGFVV